MPLWFAATALVEKLYRIERKDYKNKAQDFIRSVMKERMNCAWKAYWWARLLQVSTSKQEKKDTCKAALLEMLRDNAELETVAFALVRCQLLLSNRIVPFAEVAKCFAIVEKRFNATNQAMNMGHANFQFMQLVNFMLQGVWMLRKGERNHALNFRINQAYEKVATMDDALDEKRTWGWVSSDVIGLLVRYILGLMRVGKHGANADRKYVGKSLKSLDWYNWKGKMGRDVINKLGGRRPATLLAIMAISLGARQRLTVMDMDDACEMIRSVLALTFRARQDMSMLNQLENGKRVDLTELFDTDLCEEERRLRSEVIVLLAEYHMSIGRKSHARISGFLLKTVLCRSNNDNEYLCDSWIKADLLLSILTGKQAHLAVPHSLSWENEGTTSQDDKQVSFHNRELLALGWLANSVNQTRHSSRSNRAPNKRRSRTAVQHALSMLADQAIDGNQIVVNAKAHIFGLAASEGDDYENIKPLILESIQGSKSFGDLLSLTRVAKHWLRVSKTGRDREVQVDASRLLEETRHRVDYLQKRAPKVLVVLNRSDDKHDGNDGDHVQELQA